MRKVSHKQKWNRGAVQVQVEPSMITLIKSKNDEKLDKYFVNIKLLRYPTSQKSDLYELKIAFFYNYEPEEFLLFLQKFETTLEASGTLAASAKIQYLHTLVHGDLLGQIYTLSVEVRSTASEHLKLIILGLGTYSFLVNALSKQRCAVRRGTRKPRVSRVICYADHMIDLNDYLAF